MSPFEGGTTASRCSAPDKLRRPTHLFLTAGVEDEVLLERRLYGEGETDPEDENLRGKLLRLFDQAGAVITEIYDFKGNLLETKRRLAEDYENIVDWTDLDALTTVSAIDSAADPLLEAETFSETREFDALNRVVTIAAPDASVIVPTYNEANLLESVAVNIRGAVTATTIVENIDYDAKGQRTLIEYGNGTSTEYTYDELTFRLIDLVTTRTSPANTLQGLHYTFDPVGNVLAIADDAQQTVFFDNAVTDGSCLYEYDPTYRLVNATGREHASSVANVQRDNNDQPINSLPHANDASAVRPYEEDYVYDALGNMLQMIHTAGGSSPPSGASWNRRYDYGPYDGDVPQTNRLRSTSMPGDTPGSYPYTAQYEHDDHGNMTSMPHLAAIASSPFDQMSEADLGGGGTVYFTYTSGGERVRKVHQHIGTLVEERIYLGGYEVYRRRDSSGMVIERQTLHIMDGVKRIAMVETKTIEDDEAVVDPESIIRYQLGNHLGSAMLEVDGAGLVISYEEYAPYGGSVYRSADGTVEVSARRYRYTGKERDDETGLYYYGARYYAAWLGRWTSADPIGIAGDGPGLYNYTRGSPTTLVDPNGMEPRKPSTWDRFAEGLSLSKILENNAKSAKEIRDYVSKGARGAVEALGGGEGAQDVAEALARTPIKAIQSGVDAVNPIQTVGGLVQSLRTKGAAQTLVDSVTAPVSSLERVGTSALVGDVASASDAAGDFIFQAFTLLLGAKASPVASSPTRPTIGGGGVALAEGPLIARGAAAVNAVSLPGWLKGSALGGIALMTGGGDDDKAEGASEKGTDANAPETSAAGDITVLDKRRLERLRVDAEAFKKDQVGRSGGQYNIAVDKQGRVYLTPVKKGGAPPQETGWVQIDQSDVGSRRFVM